MYLIIIFYSVGKATLKTEYTHLLLRCKYDLNFSRITCNKYSKSIYSAISIRNQYEHMIKYVYKRKSNNAGNGSTVLQSLGNKRRKSQRSQDKRQRVRETDRHRER